MKKNQIAAQLFTVRDLLKTPESVRETLTRIRDIGYAAVQFSGYSYDVLPEQEVLAICKELGLTICATHESGDMIIDHPEQVVERLKALKCSYTAYPYPGGIDMGREDIVANLIAGLNRSGQILQEAGLTLCYHNHQIEFRKLNGKIILERIYDETNPAWLMGEIDTYWIQYGGGDGVRWCQRLAGRCPLIHLKDYRINEKHEIEFCEVGQGNLDIPAIIAAAEQSGCQWFIVEQDVCPGDPVDALAMSYAYLSTLTAD